ncbi:hypothetical protein MLD52_02860 [Puniceicoccaceae bacterium K14]|nr:hypothetical protein [Puniceicoccaceae bacterium K14]
MEKIVNSISTTLFLVVAIIIAWQTIAPFAEQKKLKGSVVETQTPELNLKNVLSGDFTTKIDTWVSNNLGFRESLVRFQNDLNYRLFKDVSRNGTRIVLGKDNWLYEYGYIANAMSKGYLDENAVSLFSDGLLQVQGFCQSKRADFFVVTAPSKVILYPEYLSDGYQKRIIKQSNKDYQMSVKAFRQKGVNFIDGPKWFAEKKIQLNKYPLFSPGGTHWGLMAGFQFLEYSIDQINKSPHVFIEKPQLQSIEYSQIKDADSDILNLLNFNKTTDFKRDMPFPVIAKNNQPLDTKIVIIGDSFAWLIVDHLRAANPSLKIDMYYYLQTKHEFRASGIKRSPVENFSFEEIVDEGDIVLAICNEAAIYSLYWRFYETLDPRL